MKHEDATAYLAAQIARTKRAIGIERMAPALLPAGLVALAWAGACLFGAQDRLPPLIGSLGAIAVLIVIALLLVRAGRAWRKPTDQDARERLARDVDLDPHALDSLEDQPSRLDSVALALWAREQARAREAAEKLKPTKPRIALNRADPLRLRYALLIAAAAGLIFAGLQAPDRLARAFLPDPGPLLGDGPIEIEAWAAPAGYTGAAPVSLSERIGKRIETPPSVEITARVTGPVGAPYLVFDGVGGHRKAAFAKAADGAWEAKLSLPGAGNLRVVRFHTKARWQIIPGADAKPAAKFVGKPAIEGDDVVFSWSASDDYGVRAMALRLRPLDGGPGLKDAPPVDVALEAPSSDPHTAKGAEKLNLLENPYAGLKVEARVVAIDAIGQEGESAPATLKLPEKIFLQPLARAAIEIRREIVRERRPYAPVPKLRKNDKPSNLIAYDPLFGTSSDPIITDEYDPRLERAPDAIRRAGRMIDALTSYPEDGYFQDTAVFMGFRGARAALDTA
ncbi:MAG TPA: DUF4175 family protein, partial [Caulobacterales bacterium]|nr:DUF4175 family protein [Caulobacterales bacterium]